MTATPTVELPLPRFRQPLGLDPDLPEVDPPTMSPPTGEEGSHPHHPSPSHLSDDQPAPPPPRLDHEAPTRRSWAGRGSGNPQTASKMLAGLLAIGLGTAAVLLARAGRQLRQPTREQLHGVTDPLGRILVRYLPLDVVADTLLDVTEAAAAGHDYVLDGPLITRIPTTEGDHS